ncbi:MAG TPA: NAD(P)-dependent oxidoreductase [Burkholderiales bacterium]|nr:NAD(P)-dependent oxidoreductase [Burkholderiales bacterium]
MSGKPILGYLGTGQMGRPMAQRLLAAGYELWVWNRSADKLSGLLERGAKAAPSPAELARRAEIVMMCVTDQRAAEEVLFGPSGVARGGSRGKLLVDFSSIAPASARGFAARLEQECGMGLVDAPVSGGVVGAANGTLVVMAGGSPAQIEALRPVIAHVAQRFTRMGGSGSGQVTKLCNQIIVGCLFPVIAEAMRLAEAAGVDAAMLPEALKGGFADSLPLQVFGPRMARREFGNPAGTSAIMLKDLENAASVAREAVVPLPMTRTASELYRMLIAQGKGEQEPSLFIELLAGKL